MIEDVSELIGAGPHGATQARGEKYVERIVESAFLLVQRILEPFVSKESLSSTSLPLKRETTFRASDCKLRKNSYIDVVHTTGPAKTLLLTLKTS